MNLDQLQDLNTVAKAVIEGLPAEQLALLPAVFAEWADGSRCRLRDLESLALHPNSRTDAPLGLHNPHMRRAADQLARIVDQLTFG